MSRRKPSPFQNCETKEGFLAALQQGLASGTLTAVDLNAAKMLCKLKGWDIPSETSEAVTPTVSAPGGDVFPPRNTVRGFWHWRENSKSPWSPPLTTEQMVAEYNRVAAEGMAAIRAAIEAGQPRHTIGRFISVGVITPKGLSDVICCELLPCTVDHLEEIDSRPPRDPNQW